MDITRPIAVLGATGVQGAPVAHALLDAGRPVRAIARTEARLHDLAAPARAAGLADVRVVGEELLANWFGWTNRTLESTAEPASVPWLWIQYAYRGYLLFQHVDRALEGRLPPALFYNLMLSARRAGPAATR